MEWLKVCSGSCALAYSYAFCATGDDGTVMSDVVILVAGLGFTESRSLDWERGTAVQP